jgi:hypothetical protein
MAWLDYSKDAFGRKMLTGVNWDLLWVPVAAAALVIAAHLVLRLVRRAG